jgi:hypothetical protein
MGTPESVRREPTKESCGSAMVLVIVLITSLTLTILILLRASELRVRSVIRENHSIQAMYLAEAGIEKALWMLSGNSGGNARWRTSGETIELFDGLTAFVSVSDWGAYVRITSEAFVHGTGRRIEALTGQTPPVAFRRAICTGNAEYALVVTGKNTINGDVLVGMRGVEQGSISGKGFEGKTPVVGRIERAEKPRIPQYNPGQAVSFMTQCETLIASPGGARIVRSGTTLDSTFAENVNDSHIHFQGDLVIRYNGQACLLDSGRVITCSGNMILSGKGMIGRNTVFAAGGRIRIEESASFKGCLFFSSRGISISGDGEMEGQFFCHSGIEVNGPSRLAFPSLLFSDGKFSGNGVSRNITLRSGAKLQGTAICYFLMNDGRIQDNAPLIQLDPSSTVTGIVYSVGQTTLEGRVYGCVATNEFYLRESETTYIHWLRDALVDRSRLPAGYTMPLLFESGSEFRMIRYESVRTLRENPKPGLVTDRNAQID